MVCGKSVVANVGYPYDQNPKDTIFAEQGCGSATIPYYTVNNRRHLNPIHIVWEGNRDVRYAGYVFSLAYRYDPMLYGPCYILENYVYKKIQRIAVDWRCSPCKSEATSSPPLDYSVFADLCCWPFLQLGLQPRHTRKDGISANGIFSASYYFQWH